MGVPIGPGSPLLSLFFDTSATNYTGPIAVNNAFHAVLHLQVNTGSVFDVTPYNVVHQPTDYAESLAFVPGLLFVILAAIALMLWIVQCTYCACSDTCRANCVACCACNEVGCRPITRYRSRGVSMEPATIALLTLGIIAILVCVASIIMWLVTSERVNSVLDDLDSLDDYRVLIGQQTAAIDALAIANNATLVDVLIPLASKTPGLNATLLHALTTTAVDASNSAVVELNEVASQGQISVNFRTTIDSVRSNTAWAVWGSFVLLVVLMLLFMSGGLAAFIPATPQRECVDASQALMGCWSLLVALVVVVVFGVGIAGGDVCQDPTAYLNELNSNSNGNNAVVSYYINCPIGGVSPFDSGLSTAYNDTIVVIGVVQTVADAAVLINATDLASNATALIAAETTLLQGILATQTLTRCNYPHRQLVQIEEDGCWSAFPNGAAAMFLMWFGYLILITAAWTWPKLAMPDTGYVRANNGDTPPPPPS